MAQCGGGTRPRTARVALDPGDGTAANPDAGTGAPGISLGQRSRSAAVRARLWTVDAAHRGAVDRAQVWRSTGSHCGRSAAGQARAHATEAAAACLPTRPQAIARWQREIYPALARRAKGEGADIFFWDESGFRADTVHGKTWGRRGETPVVHRPGQRQSMSAASAVQARGAFWFCTYQGALNAELFVELLKKMMRRRKRPVHLVVDGLPAHKKACVKDYVQSTVGRLTLHFLPGYAPDLNPDELVWSHVKRTGTARRPLQQGEKLQERIAAELLAVQRNPPLVRSFFRAPSVSYITDH